MIGEITSHKENNIEIFQTVSDAQCCMAQIYVIASDDTTHVIIGHCDAQAHDDPVLDSSA